MTHKTNTYSTTSKISPEVLEQVERIKQYVKNQERKKAEEDEAYCEVCDISYYPDEPCRLH